MTLRPAPALAAALLAAAPLAAQPATHTLPDVGARVRVVVLEARQRARATGTLVARDPDRWVVVSDRGDSLAFAPLQVEQLDVSGGRYDEGSGAWSGMRTGFLVGGGIGLVATAATAIAYRDDDSCHDCMIPPVLAVGALSVALTGATTLIGGIVGSLSRERWTRMHLPADARLGIAPTRGGAALAVRIPLP